MSTVANQLNTIKELVEYILEKHPETRGNDTKLYLRCCEELGARNIVDLYKMDLSIISVHKLRQVIQNKEGRFKPSAEVQAVRHRRASEIRDYMVRG